MNTMTSFMDKKIIISTLLMPSNNNSAPPLYFLNIKDLRLLEDTIVAAADFFVIVGGSVWRVIVEEK
jgi:hypothetical protein